MNQAHFAFRPAVALWMAALIALPAVCAASAAPVPRKSAAVREYVLDLPVSMDERIIGDLSVIISGMSLTAVDAPSWSALAPKFFSPETVQAIAAGSIDNRIPITAFTAAGMQIRYDPSRLLLILQSQHEQRAIESLSLLPGSGKGPSAIAYGSAPLSAYVNMRAVRDYVTDGRGNAPDTPLRVSLDGAARFFGARGAALQWAAFYEDQNDDRWTRGEVRVIRDDQGRAIRYAAGDVHFQTTEFQGGVPLLGFSVERRYAILQPPNAAASTGQQSFSLSRPSRVTVYVNGMFQRVFQLQPGRYSVNDFAAADGANEVRIEVEDNTGQREIIEFTLFMDATLLRRGDSEFSVNAGFRRKADTSAEIDYDFDRPAWSGFLRYGITDSLTLGGSYQGEQSLDVIGVEGVAASPWGNFFASMNMSRRDGVGTGRAGTGRWSYNIGDGPDRRLRRLDLSAIYTSSEYTSLGLDHSGNRYSWQMQTRLTTPLPGGMLASLSGRYAYVRDVSAKDETRIGLLLSKRFGNMSASFSIEQLTGTRDDVRGYLTLSIPLGARESLLANWQSQDNRRRLEWVSSPTQGAGSLSGTVGMEASDLGRSATADLTYAANRFIARGRHDIAQAGINESHTVQRARVQLETAIAFADGKVAVGRPIVDSFAIVSRHSSLKDSRIMVNQTGDGPTAVADEFGPALLPGLMSYRSQQVAWDAMHLPTGYDLGNTRRQIMPALHSGFHYQAGSAASITAVGVATRADGAPLSLVAGEIRADDTKNQRPSKTFTNRSGRFTAQALSPGNYTITFATTPPQIIRFRIDDDAATYVNLGNLQVKEK